MITINSEIVEFPDLYPVFEEFPSPITFLTSEEFPVPPEIQEVKAVCVDYDGQVQSVSVNFNSDFIEASVVNSTVDFRVSLHNELEEGTTDV